MRALLVTLLLSIPLFSENIPNHFIVGYAGRVGDKMSYTLAAEHAYPFGIISRDVTGKEVTFSYIGRDQQLIGYAKKVTFSQLSHIDLFKANGDYLGRLRHKQYSLLPAEYEVYDEKDNLVATSTTNWLGTRFTLDDPTNPNSTLVTYNRPYFRIAGRDDFWHVHIETKDALEEVAIVMIGAFQTDQQIQPKD